MSNAIDTIFQQFESGSEFDAVLVVIVGLEPTSETKEAPTVAYITGLLNYTPARKGKPTPGHLTGDVPAKLAGIVNFQASDATYQRENNATQNFDVTKEIPLRVSVERTPPSLTIEFPFGTSPVIALNADATTGIMTGSANTFYSVAFAPVRAPLRRTITPHYS